MAGQQVRSGQAGRLMVVGGKAGWGRRIVEGAESARLAGEPAFARPVQIIDADSAPDDFRTRLPECDAVFFACPDTVIDGYLAQIEAHDQVTPGDLVLLDCATSKEGFEARLKALHQAGAGVCSTHPMIKPESSPKNHNVILMPFGTDTATANDADGRALALAEAIYQALGMRPSRLEFALHSDLMVLLQLVPHLMQRLMIDTLVAGLQSERLADQHFTLPALSDYVPANFVMTELGLGRVAIQRPDVSAGIIATGMNTKLGRALIDQLEAALHSLTAPDQTRQTLADHFGTQARRLDPDGGWREQIITTTEATLARLANLRVKSFRLKAADRPGLLLGILEIFKAHDINLTALDSHVTRDSDGVMRAYFDVGVDNEQLDMARLVVDLAAIRVELLEGGGGYL